MCGFFGVFSQQSAVLENRRSIESSGSLLKHRGPDDFSTYFDSHFGVTFSRLSIIDVRNIANQPMVSKDERFILSYNGEIYNYKELRSDLRSKGVCFQTESDTEVLLEALLFWGGAALPRLRGMFAFVLWDRHTKELFAARDRLGIKPLYYFKNESTFIFSSEIKSIANYIHTDENMPTVFKYLSRGWADDSTDTFFKNIYAFPAGHTLRLGHSFNFERYWSIQYGNHTESAFAETDLLESLETTVDLHLRSDVPLAFTLSGGLDSGTIVSLAARQLKDPTSLTAFSVSPPDTVDESPWIDAVVKKTGINHRYLTLDNSTRKISKSLDEMLFANDEPCQSSNSLYQYLLRELIKQQGVKVLLVGEGGDEVFAGYRRLLYPYLYSLESSGQPDLVANTIDHANLFMEISSEEIRNRFNTFKELLSHMGSGQENLSAYSILDQDWIHSNQTFVTLPEFPLEPCPDLFMKHLEHHLLKRDIPYVLRMEDRNSMAHSIEARVPFLDHSLIEKTFSFSFMEFMRGGQNKSMLRKTLRKILPGKTINRVSKSPRPGSNVYFCYDLFKEEILERLTSPSVLLLPNARSTFEKDLRNRSNQAADFWFRFLCYDRWRHLQKNGKRLWN